MYGGYGAGLMGGGLSSMYGGYGGSLMGGGLPSMYGGYGAGLMGGGLSSMYGGYGSSLMGGGLPSMYGGYGSSLLNRNGSVTMSGMTGIAGASGSVAEGSNGAVGLPGDQGGGSLLPPQGDQGQLGRVGDIPGTESRKQRRERRRQEREAAEKHLQQKKQFAIRSTIEVVGQVLQIVMQVMRSGLELLSVGFGTYYSIRALKVLVKTQEDTASRNTSRLVTRSPSYEVQSKISGTGCSRWKPLTVALILFVLMEFFYRKLNRRHQRISAATLSKADDDALLSDSEEAESRRSLSLTEEYSSDDCSEDSVECRSGRDERHLIKRSEGGRVYVALFDYSSQDGDGIIGFKAGEHFIIEEYSNSRWCQAVQRDASGKVLREGLVPGNFLRPLEGGTKL